MNHVPHTSKSYEYSPLNGDVVGRRDKIGARIGESAIANAQERDLVDVAEFFNKNRIHLTEVQRAQFETIVERSILNRGEFVHDNEARIHEIALDAQDDSVYVNEFLPTLDSAIDDNKVEYDKEGIIRETEQIIEHSGESVPHYRAVLVEMIKQIRLGNVDARKARQAIETMHRAIDEADRKRADEIGRDLEHIEDSIVSLEQFLRYGVKLLDEKTEIIAELTNRLDELKNAKHAHVPVMKAMRSLIRQMNAQNTQDLYAKAEDLIHDMLADNSREIDI